MTPFLKKLLGMSKESRESQIRAEIATLDRVAKYGGSSDDGDRRRKALAEELEAIRAAGSREVGK
jgi:hypothetical protein